MVRPEYETVMLKHRSKGSPASGSREGAGSVDKQATRAGREIEDDEHARATMLATEDMPTFVAYDPAAVQAGTVGPSSPAIGGEEWRQAIAGLVANCAIPQCCSSSCQIAQPDRF